MHTTYLRSLRALACVPVMALATACGQGDQAREQLGASSEGFALQVSPGGTVSSATYTVSGPNGFESAGSVSVGDSPDVPVTLSHLPLGTGYELDLTATASDGVTTCEGTTTFDVTDAQPKVVVVHLTCAVPTGSANIGTTVNICPQIDDLSATPNNARLGGFVALTSAAHDSDNGPSPLSYTWTVNGVALRQHAANLNFACSSVGTLALALTVSDGDPNPSCADTASLNVRCTE